MNCPDLFNDCAELSSIRQTKWYTSFRPLTISRLAKYSQIHDFKISDVAEDAIEVRDRFMASFDILLGDVFENVRSRQLIKQKLCEEFRSNVVSPLAVNSYHRWFTHELVVLFDRLERMIGLLELGYGRSRRTEKLEERILSFFPPVLFEKRIHNQHKLYLGAPGSGSSTSYFADQAQYEDRKKDLMTTVRLVIGEFESAEQNMSAFLKSFLDDVCDCVMPKGAFAEPHRLKPTFRIGQRISRTHRLRDRHEEIFKRNNPQAHTDNHDDARQI